MNSDFSSTPSLSPDRRRERLASVALPGLQRATPTEVASAITYLHQHLPRKGGVDLLDRRHRALREFDVGLSYALEELPQANCEQARSIFAGLVTNTDVSVRRAAAYCVPSLTRVDHDFGLALWHQLVRDCSEDVREPAFLPIEEALGYPDGDKDLQAIHADCAEMGISVDEGRWLHAAFRAAEQGLDLYDPGQAALQRLMAPDATCEV